MPRILFSALGVLVLVLVFVQAVGTPFYVVDTTEQALVVEFGVIRQTISRPGLYFKQPFIQQAVLLEKRLLRLDVAESELLTLDKKALVVDAYARYRITDVRRFFETVRTEEIANSRLDAIVSSELRQEVATHNQIEVIRDNRESLMKDVTHRSAEKARDFGVEIVDVRIKRADFPEQVASRVYDRMRSERLVAANLLRAEGAEVAAQIRATADKQREVILAEAQRDSNRTRGEGEAAAIKILAAAYNVDPEFFAFLRSLEAYSKALSEGTTIVLSSDSDLFEYLTNPALPSPDKKK